MIQLMVKGIVKVKNVPWNLSTLLFFPKHWKWSVRTFGTKNSE